MPFRLAPLHLCSPGHGVTGGEMAVAAVRGDADAAHPLPAEPGLADAIARIARGDRPAFELVYAATSPKLFGIIVRIVGRRDLADDVLQDVFVRIWQRAGAFDPTYGSPITWLAAIARNRALDEVKRKTMRSLDDCPEVLLLPSGDDPLANCERSEERRRLQVCLDRLEPEKREVLLLAYCYGMTREEIARRIGRPIPTVKTWLRRSLAQVKADVAD
jgi:RNA polymerase sigma-70 factor, ECF subfamily